MLMTASKQERARRITKNDGPQTLIKTKPERGLRTMLLILFRFSPLFSHQTDLRRAAKTETIPTAKALEMIVLTAE